jgi:CheY-like chemotaxis protein
MAPGGRPLRALVVEDNPGDAGLVVRQLEEAGFTVTWQRVETEAAYRAALSPDLDVILSDFALPGFGGLEALEVLMSTDLDVPLIVVSGNLEEETAVRMLQAGAADFLFKDRLERLPEAVQGAIEERELRAERRLAE